MTEPSPWRGRALLKLVVVAAVSALLLSFAALALAQSWSDPTPAPGDNVEPVAGTSQSVVAEGTSPTGVRWQLRAGTTNAGLCVDLHTSGSGTVSGACGLPSAPPAEIEADIPPGRCHLIPVCPPLVGLDPEAAVGAVRALMPEDGLGFVFGTASGPVTMIRVNGQPVVPTNVASLGAKFWAVPLSGAEAANRIVVQGLSDAGAVLSERYHDQVCYTHSIPPSICGKQPFKILLDAEESVLNPAPPALGPDVPVTSRSTTLADDELAVSLFPSYRSETVVEAVPASSPTMASAARRLVVARRTVRLRQDRLYTVRLGLTRAGRRWLRRERPATLRVVATSRFANGRVVRTTRTLKLTR